jgi:hypothetical protein
MTAVTTTVIGKRVRLLKTTFQFSNSNSLREGDEGTIIDIHILHPRIGGRQFWVRWDRSPAFPLAIIEGEDQFVILEPKKPKPK